MSDKIYNPFEEPEGESEIAACWELLRRNKLFQKCLDIHRRCLGDIKAEVKWFYYKFYKGTEEYTGIEGDIPFFKPHPKWAGSGDHSSDSFPSFWLKLVTPTPREVSDNPILNNPHSFTLLEEQNYSDLDLDFKSLFRQYFLSYRCPFSEESALKEEVQLFGKEIFYKFLDDRPEIYIDWPAAYEFIEAYEKNIINQTKNKKILTIPTTKTFHPKSEKYLEKLIKKIVSENLNFVGKVGDFFGTDQMWADYLKLERVLGGPWLDSKKLPPTTLTKQVIHEAGIDLTKAENSNSRKNYKSILELSESIVIELTNWDNLIK